MRTAGTAGGEITRLGPLMLDEAGPEFGPVIEFSEHETVTTASATSAALTRRRRIGNPVEVGRQGPEGGPNCGETGTKITANRTDVKTLLPVNDDSHSDQAAARFFPSRRG